MLSLNKHHKSFAKDYQSTCSLFFLSFRARISIEFGTADEPVKHDTQQRALSQSSGMPLEYDESASTIEGFDMAAYSEAGWTTVGSASGNTSKDSEKGKSDQIRRRVSAHLEREVDVLFYFMNCCLYLRFDASDILNSFEASAHAHAHAHALCIQCSPKI